MTGAGEGEARTVLGRRAPEHRQAAVLDAAQQLFLADGVDATSVEAVARRAGVAKGTVYLYFPSKLHLVRELEVRFEARLVERTRAAATAETASEAAGQWCAELVRAYLDELAVHDLLFHGRVLTREEATDNALVDEFAALLRERGLEHPVEVAAFLVGGVTGLVDDAVRAGRPDAGALVSVVTQLARRSVGV
ncbi:MAG: helix-turn-helix domain containing protein [Quadrisphaera sp.]